MKIPGPFLLLAALLAASPLVAQRAALHPGDTAMIVVTGLRLAPDDPSGARTDLSVAAEASVTVTAKRGEVRTKPTAPFRAKGNTRGGGTFHTADFSVKLGETYEIVMTFKDGTVVRVADYRLPADWKTHLYFHNTTGTKSAASILRTEEDARTKLQCRVYAVFPYESYQAFGGTAAP